MFEPMTLPIAMPGDPESAAFTLVSSSGAEVPKPTSVKPMRSSERPSLRGDADGAANDAFATKRKQHKTTADLRQQFHACPARVLFITCRTMLWGSNS